MTHRTGRVQLDASESHCEPSNPCKDKATCARWLAPVPVGGKMTGAGMPAIGFFGPVCGFYIDAAAIGKSTAPKPVVHKHWSDA